MAFNCWQMGLHIQQDNIFIVALQRARIGWSLRRWWQLPLASPDDEALLAALTPWRRELPWQHALSIAFPANRTLQKNLPRAAISLRESEQNQWIASAMSQQLDMPAEALCFDYHLAEPQGCWNVTAAQQRDVARLQNLAHRLRLQVTAITPDACALRAFLPLQAEPDSVLIWRNDGQWLWASRESWGCCALSEASSPTLLSERLGMAASRLVCCAAEDQHPYFDPWSAVAQKQPPLPACGDAFAVAIGLAMEAARR
ncbi:MAG: pilus assembly protein [Kluyvera sp.]|uniref:pilus assembly protein n=1 Tax=Kluyvera sp. TaxID=1538228 RepID=UPI003A8C0CA8